MGFYGSDTDALRAWGDLCRGSAGDLDELMRRLEVQVQREDAWVGPDANAFRGTFNQDVAAQVRQVTRSLMDRTAEAVDHADEQDSASGPDDLAVGSGTMAAGIPGAKPSPLAGPAGLGSLFAGGSVAAEVSGGGLDHRGDERSGRRGDSRRHSVDNRGDDSYESDADNPNAQYSTPGPPATRKGESGLGEGSPGTTAQVPEPPGWTPPADGAGEYNSEFAGPIDHTVHSLAREGADYKRDDWPHAAENLDHFLDNNGEDKSADVDALLSDEPAFAEKAEERRHQAGHDAVAKAKAEGATGPVTYPLSTAWAGHTVPEGHDWFYASGSFNYNQTGTVTAYPPDADNPEWRYEVNTQVNFRDRYNWDGGKSTEIMGMTVTDESLAALHRAGIAKEYNLVGNSSQQTTTGTA